MPKKSFLEQMGLVERTNKQENPSASKRSPIYDGSGEDVGRTANTQNVDGKLQDLERKNRLLNEFNAGNTTSFGFAGSEILEESRSVSVEDIIPLDSLNTDMTENTEGNRVDFDVFGDTKTEPLQHSSSSIESEFAAAAEAMKKENSPAVNPLPAEVTDAEKHGKYDFEADREREINKSIDELMGLNKISSFAARESADAKTEASEQKIAMNQNETVFAHYDDPPRGLVSNEEFLSLHANSANLQASHVNLTTPTSSEEISMKEFEFSSSQSINPAKETPRASESFDIEAEEVSYVDAGNESLPYHTQVADRVGDALKADENLKSSSTFKADPYIGDKLDLIIGAYEKNKLLSIEEIYRNSRMETDTKKTIFMTDVFLKAIPTNLPLDVKRETVLNILKISGIELEMLLSDAYKRIDSLNKVHEDTIATSNDIYERNENTIRELERRIQDLRDINSARQVFQEDQNTMIEYEMQKIINLVEFVKPKTR